MTTQKLSKKQRRALRKEQKRLFKILKHKLYPNGKKPTKHHINPKSRGGNQSAMNIAMVPQGKHRAYHVLFENMTPDEIIRELVVNYWNNQWYWLTKVKKGESDGSQT